MARGIEIVRRMPRFFRSGSPSSMAALRCVFQQLATRGFKILLREHTEHTFQTSITGRFYFRNNKMTYSTVIFFSSNYLVTSKETL